MHGAGRVGRGSGEEVYCVGEGDPRRCGQLCAAEEALEGECTCMRCLSLFDDPVVTRGGESYCRKCAPLAAKEAAAESEESSPSDSFDVVAPNKQIATLCGKLVFMRQALTRLKEGI